MLAPCGGRGLGGRVEAKHELAARQAHHCNGLAPVRQRLDAWAALWQLQLPLLAAVLAAVGTPRAVVFDSGLPLQLPQLLPAQLDLLGWRLGCHGNAGSGWVASIICIGGSACCCS